MGNDKETIGDIAKGTGLLTYVVLVILGLSLLSGVVYWQFAPYFMRKETQVTRQSNQYITSHQTALRTFKSDFDNNEVRLASLRKDATGNATVISNIESQQAGIIRNMKAERDLIPNDVPPDIQQFLAGR